MSSSTDTDHLDATIPGAFPHSNASQASISTHQTLSQALQARSAEYTRPRQVRIKVGSWNVGAQKGTEKDLAAWFVEGKGIEESLAGLGVTDVEPENREGPAQQEGRRTSKAPTVPLNDEARVPGGQEIDIYALGLQEVVDITSPTEALRPYTDPSVATRWKAEVDAVLPPGYQLVAEQQLIGLLLLVYASPEVYPQVKSVSTTSVGTGLMGYMGNKGGVTARIVLGETTRLVFVNSHLAAGADKTSLDRRNWDAGQIATRTRFDPITDAFGVTQGHGEGLGEEDFAFWFGDLNYRLEGIPGDDVRRLLTIHTKGLDPDATDAPSPGSSEVSKVSSSTIVDEIPLPPDLDPASLQTTISSLIPHDELHQQQKQGKAFHDGWNEGPIRFLPSYKYDIGRVGVFDSSEKQRCPSWCDRILYRTRAAKLRYDAKAKAQEEARRIDEQMKAKGLDHAGDDEDVLFDYDPETDGDNKLDYDDYDENADPEPEPVITKDGFNDEILLEYYTTHMRVLSSDHKPLDAVFLLKYDAVVPELKTAVHQEVARELDRQENEGRPSVTLVVDRSTGSGSAFEDANTTDSAFDGVDFGDVRYVKSKRRNITIANTGRVPASFGFTDRPVDKDQPAGPFPSWLSVTFDREADKAQLSTADNLHQQYTLQPADVINAELKLKIESINDVRAFNEGTSSLDSILVLRVKDGRDHFLPIRASWQQSALARSIDKLIKIPEGGIRKLQGQKPDCEAESAKVKWSVPREIFRLTDAIEVLTERAIAEWDMTRAEGERAPWMNNAGWPFVKNSSNGGDGDQEWEREDMLAACFDALDCDQPFDTAFAQFSVLSMQRLEILAQVLVTFLRSLTDGVIPSTLWNVLDTSLQAREKAHPKTPSPTDEDAKFSVLEILASAPSHNASFLLLTSMLQRMATSVASANNITPSPATTASPVKSKTPRSSTELPASPQVSVRRKTLSKVPEEAARQLVVRNYAVVFADAMIRIPNEGAREREKAVRRERAVKVVEMFLCEL